MNILVTGGMGFIGSHTCVELLSEGYNVIIIDDLSNSRIEVKGYIEQITDKKLTFYQGDVCNKQLVEQIFNEHKIEAVIHFAGFKSVGESVLKPLEYYDNNLMSTIVLCQVMKKYNCKKIIFSSSATIYGEPEKFPIDETCKTGPTTNPYGTTKLFIEQILTDLHISDNEWDISLLRYFNPIGAHNSGLIGETPKGIPNNLLPYIVMVANKELPHLEIHGNDYDTIDGTGVRDYIHVVDLARGHVCALKKIENEHLGVNAYNLGTGKGYSVLEIVSAFKRLNNVDVPYIVGPRRSGDIATSYAKTKKACDELGFKTTKTLEDMIKDSWNFYKLQNK
ncbi:MAG: UDP-glucose 4-epimerase GalE [Bacilli bacterium]